MQAGVPTELHVYADGFHRFDGFASESDAAQRFVAKQTRLLTRALHSWAPVKQYLYHRANGRLRAGVGDFAGVCAGAQGWDFGNE